MNNDFIWTDELVKEFNKEWLPKFDTNEYTINVGMERFKKVKKPKKEYEVLSFIDINTGSIRYLVDINCYRLKSNPCFNFTFDELIDMHNMRIHSVKRLSDGKVFSIGDEIKSHVGKIDAIIENYKGQGTLLLSTNKNNGHGCVLSFAEKVKQPIKLFTTEDGKDIFNGDTFFVVSLGFLGLQQALAPSFTKNPENYKRFSTKEKAEEYILINKPCLSINDLHRLTKKSQRYSYGSNSFISFELNESELRDLAKQKINTK